MKKLSIILSSALGLLLLASCNEDNAVVPASTIVNQYYLSGEEVINIEQVPTTDYSAVEITPNVEAMTAALGCEMADIRLAALTSEELNFDGSPTAGNGGFWFNKDGYIIIYGENSAFFIEPAAEGDYSLLRVGQMPNVLVPGDVVSAELYFLKGIHYYKVTVNLTIVEPVVYPLSDYKKVGETTVEIEQDPTKDYSSTEIAVDIEGVATALGCDAAEIELAAVDANENIGDPTANNGGYWLDFDGHVTTWGTNSAAYIEPASWEDRSLLYLGQFPDAYKGGEEATFNVYFLGNGNYYQYSVKLKVKMPKVVGEFKIVAEETVTLTQSVNNEYAWSKGVAIPSMVPLVIGTNNWKVYGLANADENGNLPEGNAKYTKDYTCDPNPGFWLSKDGLNCGWGDNAYFGVAVGSVEDGMISGIQFPNRCAAGDTYKTQVFLVNEDTGNMVVVNVIYNIVE